jgi:TonB-linked SusC/RagA family outer membrane protein
MTPWHVRIPFGLALLVALAPVARSQDSASSRGIIAGQVLNAQTREPLIGAQVGVVGTQLRAQAASEGRFVIRNVPVGQRVVRVSLIGHAPMEQTVEVTSGGTTTITFAMKDLPYSVGAVVVTALGIARNERSLGYAMQTISSETLAKTNESSIMQALSGQVAGVAVTSSSGRPGAGARVVIRGETSFSGTGQPLFVIDGVPVSTATDNPSNALGTGSAGSRQMDINMENIAEISILRGAAATALYGSRAASGAVIIKTKQGTPGEPLRFSFAAEARADRPIIEGYITDWAAGSRGYFCNGRLASQGGWCEPGYPGTNTETQNNWGPHKDSIPQVVFDSLGDIRFRDVRSEFYRSPISYNTSVRGTGSLGGQLGTYTFGTSYDDERGVNPIAAKDQLSLNTNITLNLNDRLRSTSSIQRTRTQNPYSDDSFNGIDHQLINMPPTTDVRTAWMPDGSPLMFGTNSPHFQWLSENEFNTDLTNRWIVSQQFGYRVAEGLLLTNNWGLDTYVTEFGRFANERPWRTSQNITSGSTTQQKQTRTTINDDIQLTLESRPLGSSRWTVNALLGGNVYMQDASNVRGNGTSIVIPDYFNLNNFATQTTSAQLTTKRRLVGAYGQFTADFADWAFFTFTGRNDWSSTLPTTNNSYFYPSASLGVVFTDALNWHPSWLEYGKLRISKAKVGNDAPQYALSTRYVTGTLAKGASNDQQQNGGPSVQFPFRGVTAYLRSQQLGNPELKPESTVEDEIGLELRFLGGRARADISAYSKSSYDQIFSVPSSAVAGYTSITRNAGDLRNKGLEVTLSGRPLEIGRFSWDVLVNWARNKSEVLELAPGVTSLGLAGYAWPQIRIMEGQPYGVIWGYGFKRNCVEPNPCFESSPAGTLFLGDNGYPIRTDELRNLGSVPPKWIGSFRSNFRFGDVTFGGLLDVRRGSKIINFETQYTVNNGRSIITADRYTYVTHEGININTGQQNTVRLFKDQDYYPSVYGFDRHENQIEPGGFVKLRELDLSYVLPRSLVRKMGVQTASMFISARNLAVWTNFSLGDPEGDVYGGQNAGGQYFRQYPDPQTRSFVIGLRTGF